jgi:hypothetical protein
MIDCFQTLLSNFAFKLNLRRYNKVLRPDSKSQKTTFKFSRPNFAAC